MNIVKRNINDLKFHPMNEQIYGANEDISELKEDIRKSGDVMTLVITPDNVIISGHRRVRACRELAAEGDERFNEVDCEVREFSSDDEEISYLIRCNHSREKTREQRARESEKLLEVEKALAAERQESSLKQNKSTVSATLRTRSDEKKGRSSDITAETVGFESGRELERSLFAVKKIDELTAQGRTDDAQLIRNELNNGTASAAEKLAKHIDELSDEDKQDIIQRKISVNKATSKTSESKVKKAKAKPTAAMTAENTDDSTAADTANNIVDNTTNKGEIEFTPPDTSEFTSIQRVFSDLEDRTVTLYVNPKNYAEFENIVSCFKDWFYYTLMCNKKTLLAYVNRSIESGNYGADYDLLMICKDYIELIDPLYQADTEKTIQENKANDERRKKADREAEQKRLEEKERVRRESMEKSRKFSQDVQEAKRVMAERDKSEKDEW